MQGRAITETVSSNGKRTSDRSFFSCVGILPLQQGRIFLCLGDGITVSVTNSDEQDLSEGGENRVNSILSAKVIYPPPIVPELNPGGNNIIFEVVSFRLPINKQQLCIIAAQ